MNTPIEANSLDIEMELLTPEELAELETDVFEAMPGEPADTSISEVIEDAVIDVVETIIDEDIDGDGMIGDDPSSEVLTEGGIDESSFESNEVQLDDFNYQNVEIQNVEINNVVVENVELENVEVVESADDSTESESFEAAVEAQAKASEAVEVGDYEAAQYHRGNAEFEAEYAASDSMLHGPDSNELEWADHHQDRAMELESEQAANAQSGDYATARENALDAATEMQEADQLAGGSDHSGQAMLEANQMDWADWHQQQADEMLSDATAYAADGNLDSAEANFDASMNQQSQAETYGEQGTHGSDVGVYDPTADIQSNDYGSYTGDTSMTDTDSSFTDTSFTDTSYTDTSTDFTV